MRKYTRLPPAIWAEIRALWSTGGQTLQDLSDRFGVSRRTLQTHFEKHAVVKGAEAKAIAAEIHDEIFSGEFEDRDVRVAKGRETRELAFRHAARLQQAVMLQVDQVEKGGGDALRASSVLKGLALAAATIERLQSVKWEALGLGSEQTEELPQLVIQDLTVGEIADLQRVNDDDEFDADIVVGEDSGYAVNDDESPRRPEDDEIIIRH